MEMLGREIGRYRILEAIGIGSMGTVYLAEHPQIKKMVAIKVLNPELSEQPELVNRFFQEAKVVNEIKHEHVVDVLDFGRTFEGEFYIIMEYLEGSPLQKAIEQEGPFSTERLGHVGLQLCAALSAVHAKGVIHRDLKSENIFIISRSGRDFVKVLDFGMAKLLDSQQPSVFRTADGITVGTPLFMAPEQAMGDPVDHQSDIYSLGVVLYHMATNAYPFFDLNPIVVGNMHINQPVPSPRSKNPNISTRLETIIVRCLEKKRENRYRNAADVAADLSEACGLDVEAYFGGQKVFKSKPQLPALPPPRKPLANWVVAALALSLIGGTTLYVVATSSSAPVPTPPVVASQPAPQPATPQSAPVAAETLPAETTPQPTKTNKTGKTGKTTTPSKKVNEKTTLNPFQKK